MVVCASEGVRERMDGPGILYIMLEERERRRIRERGEVNIN